MSVFTQKQAVLSHLKRNKSIDTWTAIQRYGVTRLSAIIHFLKQDGENIISVRMHDPETGKNWVKYRRVK